MYRFYLYNKYHHSNIITNMHYWYTNENLPIDACASGASERIINKVNSCPENLMRGLLKKKKT